MLWQIFFAIQELVTALGPASVAVLPRRKQNTFFSPDLVRLRLNKASPKMWAKQLVREAEQKRTGQT